MEKRDWEVDGSLDGSSAFDFIPLVLGVSRNM